MGKLRKCAAKWYMENERKTYQFRGQIQLSSNENDWNLDFFGICRFIDANFYA